MNIQSVYIIVVLLVSRFFSAPSSSRLSLSQFMKTCTVKSFGFQLIAIIPLMHSGNFFPLFVFVTVLTVLDGVCIYRSTRTGDELWRICSTLVSIPMIVLFINAAWFDDGWSVASFSLVSAFCGMYSLDVMTLKQWVFRALIFTAGLLLAAHESNCFVIYLLKRNTSFFKDKKNTMDRSRGMGKLIGYLERSLVYVLIISGNLSTIGFVLAAKALARFKELENKDFAEYFLLGTMISMVFTIALSFGVRWALKVST